MSAWPEALQPNRCFLTGTEGELLSVSIAVEPNHLEGLLDALAELPFPVNPEIYHRPAAAALVEFPAYTERLPEIQRLLTERGISIESLRSTSMLEQIRGRGYNTNW